MASAPKIRKLDDVVINRIAAGEVIQRPANALKEMIENSLDAGASTITVTVKQGGLKMMQIQDNGVGIRKEDLEIVCERFTTSKLTKFEDLLDIHTYGFRGEALASISHVAHVTIVTKTADSPVGFKACYEDGKLKGPVKPCAALQGTQIRVEDLFYNIATRRKALKNFSEEYAKIFEVVSRYAVHNSLVSFCLKKEGENNTDVKTLVNSTAAENIRLIFGNNLGKELIEIKGADETLQFQIDGFVTNPNYSDKKFTFLLFINHRLVESTALKKTIDQIFGTYLPKGSHPFAYLSIELNPSNVDVNVHPTKHEVHFLHEEAIVDRVRTIIEEKLSGANTSRNMYTQAKIPVNFSIVEKTLQEKRPAEMVRVDGSEQKIEKFFKETQPAKDEKNTAKRAIKLRSVLQLRADVENNAHKGLLQFIKNFVFVGVVSPEKCLLQHETKLFLCSTLKLVAELFYEIVVFDFANFGIIKFATPIPIVDLVMIYLDSENSGWTEEDGPKTELAQGMLTLLQEKCAMLEDYFSIEIVDDTICSLPLLLDQHVPNMALLPDFIVRVCTEVDWELEQPCLEGIARELARFYCQLTVEDDEMDNVADSKWKWQVEHILMPGVKAILLPPSGFATDGTLLEIAHLPDLYRVFERC